MTLRSSPRPPGSEPSADWQHNNPDSAGVVLETLLVLRRSWPVLVATTTIAIVLSLVSESRRQPVYSATASVQVGGAARPMAGIAPGAEETLPWGVDHVLTQTEILKSRAVAVEAVDSAGLRLLPLTPGLGVQFFDPVVTAPSVMTDTLQFRFEADRYAVVGRQGTDSAAYGEPVLGAVHVTVLSRPPVDDARVALLSHDEATDWLRGAVNIRQRPSTTILDISVTAADPYHAARAANAMAHAFRSITRRQGREDSRARRVFLEDQLGVTDSLLILAEQRLTQHRREQQSYDTRSRFAGNEAVLGRLRADESALQRDLQVYRSLLADLDASTSKPEQSLAAVSAVSSSVSDFYREWRSARRALDSLVTGPYARTNRHPDVIRVQARMDAARHDLTEAVNGQISVLEQRLRLIEADRRKTGGEISVLPEVEAREVRLLREVEGYRRASETLRDELQLARVAAAVEGGPVELLDAAQPSLRPLGPRRMRKVLFAAVIGLAVGIAIALARYRLNTSLRRAGDVQRILAAPGLAVIPRLRDPDWRHILRRSRRAALPDVSPVDIVSLEPATAGAESYRQLMTAVAFARESRSFRVVAVTSPSPAEGKSTTAANLAVTFALHGRRVLLIDADLRRGRMHDIFQIQREPGLADALMTGRIEPGSLQKSAHASLDVLTRGRQVHNPLELVSSPNLRELFAAVREQYDVVVVDTSPVLPAAEAPLVAACAEAVLIVLRAGQTKPAALETTLQQLDRFGATILGTVLNDPDAEVLDYPIEHYAYYASDATAAT